MKRYELLAKYFYDLSKILFTSFVIGEILTLNRGRIIIAGVALSGVLFLAGLVVYKPKKGGKHV
jgi:hypothetical protein